jgi:hypothetical protein
MMPRRMGSLLSRDKQNKWAVIKHGLVYRTIAYKWLVLVKFSAIPLK